MTKERPILFSGPMVRAILDGRKTQTRRVVKPTPSWSAMEPNKYGGRKVDWQKMDWIRPYSGVSDCRGWFTAGLEKHRTGCHGHFRSPYGKPGDRLWVREAFYCNDYRYPDAPPEELLEEITYRAEHESPCRCEEPLDGFWKPSIHMPRWASRINLEITGVRVERLQDLSEADAMAEGIRREDLPSDSDNFHPPGSYGYVHDLDPFPKGRIFVTPQEAFKEAWDRINGKKHPWASNPWLWVITFNQIGATDA